MIKLLNLTLNQSVESCSEILWIVSYQLLATSVIFLMAAFYSKLSLCFKFADCSWYRKPATTPHLPRRFFCHTNSQLLQIKQHVATRRGLILPKTFNFDKNCCRIEINLNCRHTGSTWLLAKCDQWLPFDIIDTDICKIPAGSLQQTGCQVHLNVTNHIFKSTAHPWFVRYTVSTLH